MCVSNQLLTVFRVTVLYSLECLVGAEIMFPLGDRESLLKDKQTRGKITHSGYDSRILLKKYKSPD